MTETFTLLQPYEIDNLVNYYIHYKSDQHGPTAISMGEFLDFLAPFQTGWSRVELMTYLDDQWTF